MWFLFLTTGMRRGEVAGLRWSDVNLSTGSIAVRSQRTTLDHAVVANDPKTPTSRAPVAIDADLVDALRCHQRQQMDERLLMGEGWNDSGLVFVWADGTPYHPQHITRMCKRLAEQAGVPALTPHDLRHTCASLLVEAGIPLKVVQERLRHASVLDNRRSIRSRWRGHPARSGEDNRGDPAAHDQGRLSCGPSGIPFMTFGLRAHVLNEEFDAAVNDREPHVASKNGARAYPWETFRSRVLSVHLVGHRLFRQLRVRTQSSRSPPVHPVRLRLVATQSQEIR